VPRTASAYRRGSASDVGTILVFPSGCEQAEEGGREPYKRRSREADASCKKFRLHVDSAILLIRRTALLAPQADKPTRALADISGPPLAAHGTAANIAAVWRFWCSVAEHGSVFIWRDAGACSRRFSVAG
jgi:hypothetical protein